ncbi:MAG: xanthine dehydrogenase family protein molybdopterin-binding subunit [Halanaerobium sp.]|nr:xanthine dehydrogenase family protein molybdopterin-binding subunit [Halanaerobium sp.]
MIEETIIGKSITRIDAVEKAMGVAPYVHDLEMPGMLFAKILTSPHAHARIVRIDTSEAEKLPGVWAILTGKDLDYKIGLYLVDKDILAKEKVIYQGEPVVAVAAETDDIASQALEAIEVEYEELPAVFDPREAIKEGAPLVHERLGEYHHMEGVFFPKPGTNIANHFKLRKGDVEKGFAEADKVFENEYYVPQIDHVAMETHCCICQWRPDDKIKIWTSAQSPFAVRNLFSEGLKIPHNQIEVIVPYVGGGFGGKAGIHFEPLTACLSRAAGGAPVKFSCTREEEFNTVPVRQGLHSRVKTGVRNDGKIIAQEMTFLWDSGGNADYGVNVTRASGFSSTGPYEIANVKVDALTVYTNKVFGTAYRGFGHSEVLWAMERQLDIIADEMGIDPLELRLLNVLRPGDITATGERIYAHTGNIAGCLETVAGEIGWAEKKKAAKKVEDHRVKGVGIAALHKAPAMPTNVGAGAFLKFNENGSINLTVSLIDYGQGTYTSLAQIVADQLKIPIEKVNVVYETNTETMPYDWQTVASKGLFISGNAVINACKDMANQLKEIAARALRASVEDVELGEEKVYLKHDPAEYVNYVNLVMGYTYPNGNAIGGPLMARGSYIAQGLTNLEPGTGQGLPALDWTYGAHAVEIEVDVETGEYDVLKAVSAFDAGKVVNELSVMGQIQGGFIQGFGSAVFEGYIYNDKGQLLTNSFTDYKIPTTMDIPGEMLPICLETAQPDGPYGARGVAEHPMISVPPVIANALQDALGIRLMEIPLTPEKIVAALDKEKGQ